MLSTTDRTPLSRAMVQNSRICGWIDGSPPDGFGFAFGGDERVEARQDLSQREGEPVRLMAGVGEADRAVEVAGGVDLDQPDAGVLLVVGAEPAVERQPSWTSVWVCSGSVPGLLNRSNAAYISASP